jgi:hypothetical protein
MLELVCYERALKRAIDKEQAVVAAWEAAAAAKKR